MMNLLDACLINAIKISSASVLSYDYGPCTPNIFFLHSARQMEWIGDFARNTPPYELETMFL